MATKPSSPRRAIQRATLYDLSPTIDPSLPVWPGDTPFSSRWVARLDEEASVNLSTITTTAHLGSHADAPLHTERSGVGIDAMPLEPYLGPCRVVEVQARELARPEDLPSFDATHTPRLLLKTSSARESDRFPQHFVALSVELARLFVDRGIVLVGTDCPSIDPFTSQSLEAHHILLGHGVAVLEGLCLRHVPAGVYELLALPLKMRGLDASPVRAVLRRLPSPHGADLRGPGSK